MPRSFNYAVFVVMAFFFACFFLMPIWSTLEVAFLGVKGQFTLDYLAGIFRSPMYREGWRMLHHRSVDHPGLLAALPATRGALPPL